MRIQNVFLKEYEINKVNSIGGCMPISKELKKRIHRICGKCKHGGSHFKLRDGTHLHCDIVASKQEAEGRIDPWDSLRRWFDKCDQDQWATK